MSIEQYKRQIGRFLASKDPEVLCIRGKWGVGKTVTWNKFLEAAKATVALNYYSYVSLFGIGSLDELKYAIFTNTINKSKIGEPASLETFGEKIEAAKGQGRKGLYWLLQLPWLKNHAGVVTPALLLAVKDQIICIDDLERKSKNLSAKDVLGLISYLKEQKKCKIVLLLNDGELADDEKNDFQRYLEKVADEMLRFDPSPQEAAAIGLPNNEYPDVARHCVTLNISNIRIIKKIEASVKRVQPMLAEFDPEVFTRAQHSLALLVWSFYKGDNAPEFDFIKERLPDNYTAYIRKRLRLSGRREAEPEEDKRYAAWNATLEAYAFGSLDELDRALVQGLENGFFDEDEIKKGAREINQQILASRSNNSLEEAWNQYHDSFADNQPEVIDNLFAQSVANIQRISLNNLDGTVRCLKELGRSDLAAQFLARYMAERNENQNFYDLEDMPFGGSITDPDVRQAIEAKFNSFIPPPNSGNVLLRLGERTGWSKEEMDLAARLPVDEYYRVLKGAEGKQLRSVIAFCLQFDNATQVQPVYAQIAVKARQALERIGAESPLNARRVKKYLGQPPEEVEADVPDEDSEQEQDG